MAAEARAAGTIALHPEATDAPATLRWRAPRTEIPFAGVVATAPGLDELEPGLVERVEAHTGSLLVTLAAGRSWREEGARVRHALVAALSHPDRWTPAPDARALDADALLRAVAEEAIAGPIGDIAALHGGAIELADARDGVVEVRMHGACRGCAAATITLHQRFERELARWAPGFREVREVF